MWAKQEVPLLLAIRDAAPGLVVRSLRQHPNGFRLAVSDVEAFRRAVSGSRALHTCTTELPTRPPPQLEITLAVPASIPTESILDDLRSRIGDSVRHVRRLHATTAGKVDRSRPQDRVVVAVNGEETATKVREARLFGVLAPSASTARQVTEVTQCLRCFRMGHRAAACRQERRCIRCGSTQHDTTTCSVPREQTTCLNCNGRHAVTYRGCPHRLRAARDIERTKRQQPASTTRTRPQQPAPPPPPPPSSNALATPQGVTYAKAAARNAAPNRLNRPQATPTPLSNPQTSTRPPATSQEQKALEAQLDQANRERREARQDHAHFRSRGSKTELNRANRKCATLRRQLKRLHERQPAPTAPQRQQPPTTDNSRRQQPLPPQERHQQPTTRPPTLAPGPATEGDQELDVNLLLRQVHALIRVSPDRDSALFALDSVLAALPSHHTVALHNA